MLYYKVRAFFETQRCGIQLFFLWFAASTDQRNFCFKSSYMVSITWHTSNTWEYTGKKGGFGRKGYVACTGGYECIMHNACIGGLGNTSSLPIVMINVVFESTPFWALGVYGRILKAPIPQYTAVYSGVYGRILRVYGRILGVFVCTTWLFQVEKFHCCAFCAHLVAFFAFAQQLHTMGCSVLGRGAEPPQFWVLLIWLEPGISHVTWVHYDATMCLPCFVCSILPVLHFLRFDLCVL